MQITSVAMPTNTRNEREQLRRPSERKLKRQTTRQKLETDRPTGLGDIERQVGRQTKSQRETKERLKECRTDTLVQTTRHFSVTKVSPPTVLTNAFVVSKPRTCKYHVSKKRRSELRIQVSGVGKWFTCTKTHT